MLYETRREKTLVFPILVLTTMSSLAPGQSVLDKLKAKIDQAGKKIDQSGKTVNQPSQPQPGQPPQQPPPSSQNQAPAPRPANAASLERPPGDVAALAATAGFVDIAGIKLGMTVQDTMLALRAANPDLKLDPTTFRLPGFGDQDLLDAVRATTLNELETYTLSFTLPPSKEVLWSLQRYIRFPEKERPTTGKVLAELQKKYGQPIGSEPTSSVRLWFFDTRGGSQRVDAVPGMSQGTFSCYSGGSSAQNEISVGYNRTTYKAGGVEKDCSNLVVVKADIAQEGGNYGRPDQAVQGLMVTIENLALYRATVEATRAVALGAQQGQDAKDAEEIKKRSVPKL